MSGTGSAVGGPAGPSDQGLVEALQRLASARAHLLAAERAADEASGVGAGVDRNDEIEGAHAKLLLAQAGFITDRRQQRARRRLEEAKERLRLVLRRHGYPSFADYLADRAQVPTSDLHLDVARREYRETEQAWERLRTDLDMAVEPDIPTIVIDVTGDVPRRLA